MLHGEVDRHGTKLSPPEPYLDDGFEGNAQTFRIVGVIDFRKTKERRYGLNLTWRTLAAILKYPWLHSDVPEEFSRKKKWGAYNSEAHLLEGAIAYAKEAGIYGERSIEAQIMDWADDVAYAVHDVEDFYRAGLIPLARLYADDDEWNSVKEMIRAWLEKDPQIDFEASGYETVTNELLRPFLPSNPYRGSAKDRFKIHSFASLQISSLTNEEAISLDDDCNLVSSPEAQMRAGFLKSLTRYYVISDPAMLADQTGQRRVVRELFFDLYDLVRGAWLPPDELEQRRLPPRLNDYCQSALESEYMNVYGSETSKLARATADFIASLTDRQAGLLHRRLRGEPQERLRFHWLSV